VLYCAQVIHVDMYDAPARMPPLMVNYHKDLAQATTGEPWRSDLKAINITQPQGPSFSVEGNMVRHTGGGGAIVRGGKSCGGDGGKV
jgi:Cu2+-containing amine oxidase